MCTTCNSGITLNTMLLTVQINPFMPSGLFYLNSLNQSISHKRGVWLVFIITMLLEISVFNANSIDSDQTPRSAVFTVYQCPFYGTPLGLIRIKCISSEKRYTLIAKNLPP